jgi:cytochrome P450
MAFPDLSVLRYSVVLLVPVVLYFFYFSGVKTPKGYAKVPRVPGWPIVGNTLQLGPHPEATLYDWGQKYGELFIVKVLGIDFFVTASPEAIKEVFDKQSAVTSSRPYTPAFSEVISEGYRMVNMQYGPKWRQLRSIVHKLTTPKVSDNLRPSQEFEAKQVAYDLLVDNQKGSEFYTHTRRYTTSVMMTSTYGQRIPTWVSYLPLPMVKKKKDLSPNAAIGE